MKSKKESALKKLDSLIERWKESDVPWKEWAYGFVLCLMYIHIFDYDESADILRERGIIR